MKVKCKHGGCKGEPPFDYTPRKVNPLRHRPICPKGHFNSISKTEFDELNFGQIATSPSLGPKPSMDAPEKFGQIATSPSLGPDASSIATEKDRVKGFTTSRVPSDTSCGEFGRNGGFYLSNRDLKKFFKKNRIFNLDLKLAFLWTGGMPESKRNLTEIAARVKRSKQFVAYRTKKLVKLGLLIPIPGFNGLYEKNLEYLWKLDPELKVQIETNQPVIQSNPPAEFEQEQSKPKVKPRRKAPERLDIEWHDTPFIWKPKSLAAYQKVIKAFPIDHFLSENNPIRIIPDKMLDDYGLKEFCLPNYRILLYTRSVGLYLYPKTGGSISDAITDIKRHGEALQAKIKNLMNIEFKWSPEVEKQIKRHSPHYVLAPVQVQAPTAPAPAPVQVQAPTAPAPAPVQVQAPLLASSKVEEQAQIIALALEKILPRFFQKMIQPQVHFVGSDGSHEDGVEGTTDLVYPIRDTYNQVKLIDRDVVELKYKVAAVEKVPAMVEAAVEKGIQRVMPDLAKSMAESFVKALQQGQQEVPRPGPAPEASYM